MPTDNIIVAIHQPNFFPWLGYFAKIARSSHFVFLDHVQFQKTGGVWSNRVRLMVGGDAQWVTAPIVRTFHGTRAVNEIEFADGQRWRDKLVQSLRTNYGRAPFFRETMAVVEPLVHHPDRRLASYNSHAVIAIVDHLGLRAPQWHWSSSLGVSGRATDLLVAITRRVGGDTYLSGDGAGGYQQDEMFAASGVHLRQLQFEHQEYPQTHRGGFVAGLSVIDALMNCGAACVRQILELNDRSS